MSKAAIPPKNGAAVNPEWLEKRNRYIKWYTELGLVPIPLNGKRPYQKKWQERKPNLKYEEVIQLFRPDDNVGLLMGIPFNGPSSYLRGIDYDDLALRALHQQPLPHDPDYLIEWIDTGVIVQTGSGKFHHYIISDVPDKFVFRGISLSHGGEVQGTGSQLVAPPSIHPETGNEYIFISENFDKLSFLLDSDLKQGFIPYNAAPSAVPTARPKFTAKDADLFSVRGDGAGGDDSYDYNSIDWAKYFHDHEVVYQNRGGNSYIVRCPNAGNHSSNTDGTTSTMLLSSKTQPGRFRFNCKHGGCIHLNDQDGLIEFIGGPSVIRPYARTYNVCTADTDLVNRFTYNQYSKDPNVHVIDLESCKRGYKWEEELSNGGSGRIVQPRNLKPPGRLGALYDWINATAPNPIPVLTLGASLAFSSALLGHAYVGLGGAKPQLYCVGIAPTGVGKEHPRAAIKSLTSLIGQHVTNRVLDGKMTSLRAMEMALEKRMGRMVWFLDEFGKALMPMLSNSGEGSSSHIAALQDALLQFDGMTNTVYNGQNYADSDKTKTVNIKWPILSMYGTTAPNRYIDTLDAKLIHDGFLNRILHFRSREPAPIHRPLEMDYVLDAPPDYLKEIVAEWERCSMEDDFGNGPGFVQDGDPMPRITPRKIGVSPEAAEMFREFELEVHLWKAQLARRIEHGDDILARTTWKVRKVAITVAAADDRRIVDEEIMAWSIDIVRYCESEVVSMVPDIEASQRARHRSKELDSLLRFIAEMEEEGVSLSELTRKFRSTLDRKKRDDLLSTLTDSGEIVKLVSDASGNGKRPVTRYIAIQYYTIPPDQLPTPTVEGAEEPPAE